jgi:hypothetical protein
MRHAGTPEMRHAGTPEIHHDVRVRLAAHSLTSGAGSRVEVPPERNAAAGDRVMTDRGLETGRGQPRALAAKVCARREQVPHLAEERAVVKAPVRVAVSRVMTLPNRFAGGVETMPHHRVAMPLV